MQSDLKKWVIINEFIDRLEIHVTDDEEYCVCNSQPQHSILDI